jgi:hypothetical protein
MITPLKTGVAYHSNRILKSVQEDMIDCVNHNMNLVVHMYTHNDMDRHKYVMKDIISITEDLGLECWVDNWGLGGPPGEKSHFLAYHPEAHQYFSNGDMDPVHACYNAPSFVAFSKTWVDHVAEAGGKTLFWDEPHLLGKSINGKMEYTCRCETCQKVFEERYNRPMPRDFDADCMEFRTWSIIHYFRTVTDYAASLGLKNTTCVMLNPIFGISLDNLDQLGTLPHLDSLGSDPYWIGANPENVYQFVYEKTRTNLEMADTYQKDHNLWIQGYNIPAGREDEIIYATDAAYDAGARTIINWSFRGGESNNYRCDKPEVAWRVIGESMARIRNRHNDEVRRLSMELRSK